MMALIDIHRDSDEPFDVVVSVWSDHIPEGEVPAQVTAFAEAGVTWWIDSLDPWRFGWQHQNDEWPLAQIREAIQQGPPHL